MKRSITQWAAHYFEDLDNLTFSRDNYSLLKFGSIAVAKSFGYEIADKFFEEHKSVLATRDLVVIPSPYRYVKTAAGATTEFFFTRLNELLVLNFNKVAEYSLIHRSGSHTSDYGFLSKEGRKGLLKDHKYSANYSQLENKLLIVLDDVFITGTHEDKLIDFLDEAKVDNDIMCIYYAKFEGTKSADIEAELNLSKIKTFEDYIGMFNDQDFELLVRPLKFTMQQEPEYLKLILARSTKNFLEKAYHSFINEGYCYLGKYKEAFEILKSEMSNRQSMALFS